MIPYGKQSIDENDIRAVVEVLRSDWLTTGPLVEKFERAVADFIGAKHAVAVNSGTAALHSTMFALNIATGDEVIVAALTFAATANAVVYQGATPIFADVDEHTLLIDPDVVESKITRKTKCIIAIDYTGQPCDYDALKYITKKKGIYLVADGCHALGAEYRGQKVGTIAELTAFSFHPVKHITTGEGGLVTTDNSEFAKRMARFRNHGINTDYRIREQRATWHYEMIDLGYNYRITDFQCALGMSQLSKLPGWIARRQEIAHRYNTAFAELSSVEPLQVREGLSHAYHLYVIRLNLEKLQADRADVFAALRAKGIGVNVHYIPVHLHPFYRNRFGTAPGMCPVAEAAYERLLSLPIFHGMSDDDVDSVIETVTNLVRSYTVH
jgi:perosamine synthetase